MVRSFALPIALLFAVFAVLSSQDTLAQDILPDPLPDIVDTAIAAGSFDTLVAAVQAANLEDTLRGEGPFTVFAPTDDAFAALPEGTLDSLLLPENLDQLTSILTYHVAPGMLMAADVVGMTSIETVNGQSLTVTVMDGNVMIDDANVVQTDIETSNGVIHVIDAVVIPPPEPLPDIVDTAIAAGSFDTLVAAVQAAGLEDTLRGEGPFTVFAPTDDAFAALPEGTVDSLLLPENLDQLVSILTYHVVPGKLMAVDVVGMTSIETVNGQPLTVTVMNGNVMIDDANVTQTDIETSNGVIHVIDAVVIPPPEPLPDIVDTAIAAGSFNTLVAAVQAAGLEDTLRGEGPFTVFAPTDDAFAALPEGTVDSLLLPENLDQLVSILTYHVVPGKLMAADVAAMDTLNTVNGDPLAVTLVDGDVTFGPATVIQADIEASNGVIHVVDNVILPVIEEPLPDIVDTAIAAGSFSTLVAAVQAAGLEDTLRGEGPFTVFAPTDDAFAALPEGTLDSLLLPENLDQLVSILTYHVVPGKLMAADVVGMTSIDTVNGQPLTVTVMNGNVMIDDANVTQTDIETSNGVIHIIDAVLLPEEEEDRDYTNVFFLELSEGLNMVSLPLEPSEPYTARSFAQAVEATVVIRYNTETGRFEAFTPLMEGDGFAIEGGQGYIINRMTSGVVTFVGAAWVNQPPAQAAPPVTKLNSAWAFAVTGKLDLISSQVYNVTARNLRTGFVATNPVMQNGSFAAVFADLNRNPVVQAGDNLEIVIKDASGKIVSGPVVGQIGNGDISRAFTNHILRFGYIAPEKSMLLQNYPNPFNPETWIPYQLSERSDVNIRIYNSSGTLVRILALGHKEAGIYSSKSEAAYWDGMTESGELAANGVYFYTMQAGQFASTRKMIVLK